MRFRITFVLARALEEARAVIADLDDDQVPASLRRVAAHSGELTPPLAESLAREIDRLDWLREQALERWEGADPSAGGPHRASALFLARPEGWARDLVRLAWEAGSEAQSVASERGERSRRSLESDLAGAREKVKGLQKEIEALRAEAAAGKREAGVPERRRRAAGARSEQALRKELSELESTVEAREQEIGRLQRELSEVREELRETRRSRADAEAAINELRAGGGWSTREPLELARHLDALMQQATRSVASMEGSDASLAAPALPVGVRPDTAEAIDAVLRLPGPVGVIIDGYNAGLALGEGSPAEVRSRLEDVARRLRRLGGHAMTVTVVWDSTLEQTTRRRPDGLDVRFAPAGTPADDVVVALAAVGGRSIVITNDREVRERAEAQGSLALWSDALVAWARRR